MTNEEYLAKVLKCFERIADALERIAPPKVEIKGEPADIDNLIRPSLRDIKRWEDEERAQKNDGMI
jgi:hypothetical protein